MLLDLAQIKADLDAQTDGKYYHQIEHGVYPFGEMFHVTMFEYSGAKGEIQYSIMRAHGKGSTIDEAKRNLLKCFKFAELYR